MVRAGKHAATTCANAEAAHYLTLALDLTPEAEINERFDLLLAREKVYDLQGNWAAQEADLAQLADLVGQLAVAQQAQIVLRQARYAEATSDYEGTIAQAQAAIAIAEPEGLWEVVAGGDARWGNALQRQGQYAAARSYYERSLALSQEIGLRWGGGSTLNSLGMLALRQNQLEPALAHLQQAQAIHHELHQPHYLVENWVGLAKVAFLQGDRSQTETYLEQILAHIKASPNLAGPRTLCRRSG